MEICNSTLTVCYSDDMSTGAMLVLNLTGGTLTPYDFILNGASDQNLEPPVVTTASSTSAVPEPASLLLLGLDVTCLMIGRPRLGHPFRRVSMLGAD